MQTDGMVSDVDPRFQDSERLNGLSRRGFFNRMISGTAAGAALLSLGSKTFAATPEDLSTMPRGAAADDEAYWEKVADQFILHPGLAYMNTGTKGPSPIGVHQAQSDALEGVNSDYKRYSSGVYNRDFQDNLKKKMAEFIGAMPEEVAFTNNTTEGMVFGTMGLDLKRGDEIVCTNHDHVGGVNPILQRAAQDGLEVKIIDLSNPKYHPPDSPDVLLKAFESGVSSKTKLLSFCHINYTDGGVMPVKEICEMARARGIVTLVDGAQPPGMMKLDMKDLGCDMYAGPCHKWMLASMYTGFLYIKQDIMDRVSPYIYTGPTNGKNMYGDLSPSAVEYYDKALKTAGKFEMRMSGNTPGRTSIDAAIDFHNHLTREGVEARDRYLARYLMDRLRTIDGVKLYVSEDPRLSCALVSFTVKNIPTGEVNNYLWNRSIYIRSVVHKEINWAVNRASMHVMVRKSQVDNLLDGIESVAKG